MLDIPKEDPQVRRFIKLVKEEGYSYEKALEEVGADYIDERDWEYFGFNQREGDYRDFYNLRHPPKEHHYLSGSNSSSGSSSNKRQSSKWDDLKCYMSVLGPLIIIFAIAILWGVFKGG
ncbi:hypothetical protein mru_0639 [Methanobrevibacter ruminantium M1]|uniref:Uncharacterized protein n=1 Tax=Methanobrevibacter ruminantium (strain ATCC 35063 / DSM 1093 / JCM 13430 / OCM 146 / M1) TaxID=634498 RepID=D3E1S9_METRM|nr:hypothetical protein [Methanobrevibacter ruminantium]ADC46490.1 hypothetical protein mru_0639 [Methanobrevibacter ruminantium M1]